MFQWLKKLFSTSDLSSEDQQNEPLDVNGRRIILLPGLNIRGAVLITELGVKVSKNKASVAPVALGAHPDIQAMVRKGYITIEDFDPAQVRIEQDTESFYRNMSLTYVDEPREMQVTEDRHDLDSRRAIEGPDSEECPIVVAGREPIPERVLLDEGRK